MDATIGNDPHCLVTGRTHLFEGLLDLAVGTETPLGKIIEMEGPFIRLEGQTNLWWESMRADPTRQDDGYCPFIFETIFTFD